MELKDKVIIVSGGSGLIGRAIVADIKRRGGIAINADIAVETNLDKEYTIQCNVTSDDSIQETIDTVFNNFGKIDGLVNSAYPRTPDRRSRFEEMKPESWRINVDWQMNSCFVFCQKALIKMKEQGFGSIVNIGSIYGVVGNDFTLYEAYGGTSSPSYSAVKGGIINLTRFMASYFGPLQIRVNCVSPGGIKDETNQHPSFIERYEAKVPMRRMGNPEDIAPAVSFLLSDDAKYITGQNLLVDGGWTAI
ncbi:MAG: SDR family oxidoreductase [Bacteroidales bacterium]|nr:SDR family oxidoreductase [Bacteroidales bacterium]